MSAHHPSSSLDRNSAETLYSQLAKILRLRLSSSSQKPGTRLPSIRTLINEYQVSLPVVRQALAVLKSDGLIQTERGRGIYIASIGNNASPTVRRKDASSPLFVIVGRTTTDPFYSRTLFGFEKSATMENASFSFCRCPCSPSAITSTISARNPVGVVISGVFNNSIIDAVVKCGIPCVFCGSPQEPKEPDSVFQVIGDDYSGGYIAGQHLVAMGHRRIGFFCGRLQMIYWSSLHKGFQDAMSDGGIPWEEVKCVYDSGTGPDSCNSCAVNLLSDPVPPTAIFCANDQYARYIISVCASKRLTIPHQVSLVGYNDLAFASELTPPLTTVHLDIEDMGSNSWTLLKEAISGAAPHRITIPVRLVRRASVSNPLGKV